MPNERYYKKALEAILMVPNFQVVGGRSESSPMEKVKTIAETAKAGGDIDPFIEFLEQFDPGEVEDDEEADTLVCGNCDAELEDGLVCQECGTENE